MWHKALWKYHFKKSGWLIGGTWLGSLLLLFFIIGGNLVHQFYQFTLNGHSPIRLNFIEIFGIHLIGVALLSILLLSNERNEKGLEHLLVFPFKRSTIYWSKWFYGVFTISGLILSNAFVIVFQFFNSPVNHRISFLSFIPFFALSFLALLTVFTFMLMIGMIAGTKISHGVLGLVGMILPFGLVMLAVRIIGMHLEWLNSYSWSVINFITGIFVQLLYQITLVLTLEFSLVITVISTDILWLSEGNHIWVFICYLVFSLLIGYFLFVKNPMERNGNLVIYPKLEPFIRWSFIILTALTISGLFINQLWGQIWIQALVFYGIFLTSSVVLYFLLKQFGRKNNAT